MSRRRLLLLAFGFPPAAKSSAYRLREIGNQFAALGWDVTVLNAHRAHWERETGLDLSMLDHVDPRVQVVELPVWRADQDTDIRTYSRGRALNPRRWVRRWDEAGFAEFPESKFGGWRGAVESAVRELHEADAFDLVLASCAPYVMLAGARVLHEEYALPYVVDFRDGWSIDVVSGAVAFDKDSAAGRWEERALTGASAFWVVNEPIAEHYRARYPQLAERVHVVRNGFDLDSVPEPVPVRTGGRPLRIGYLGTVNFPWTTLAVVLDGWRQARARDPLLADATLELRGYVGTSWSREANQVTELIRTSATDGVSFGGPVPKASVAEVYASWDALLLILVGGRYVTSGKVYEYLATGLPVMSVHEQEHDAALLLRRYPMWTDVAALDVAAVATAFSAAARMAGERTEDQRRAARAHAEGFERSGLMRAAVADVDSLVTPAEHS